MKKEHIILIGAGLAGSLLAIFLAKRGFRVSVYERRADMRLLDISAGRSINLALSLRGIHALRQAGLADTVLKEAIPMRGRMIHAVNGGLTFQAYGKSADEVINSISRGGLNRTLMDAAESCESVSLHFQHRCLGMDFDSGEVFFRNDMSGNEYSVSGQTVIATDGATSAIRLDMQKTDRFNLNQFYLEHGYKELTIPAAGGNGFSIEKHALHIWPRGTYMLIALPNLDGSFTCTLFNPYQGEHGFDSLDSPERVQRLFNSKFADAATLMPALVDDFFGNPTGSLITIKCAPWHIDGKALLLGDSAHAMVPFYGQGMNCAFEDCVILDACIEAHGADWAAVFAAYQAKRKPDADAIADLALENFIEMRDSVADPAFLLKRRVELMLEEQFPGEFYSKYGMVTFQRISYAIARDLGNRQDEILMDICSKASSVEELDLSEVYRTLRHRLDSGDNEISG